MHKSLIGCLRLSALFAASFVAVGCGSSSDSGAAAATPASTGGSGGAAGAGGSDASEGGAAGTGTGGAAAGAAGMSAGGASAGGADSGGAAGAGQAGGSGGSAPNGVPLTGPDKTWTWVDFPDSQCRDGSHTGIGINLNSASDKVMIFLEGGGACFNPLICDQNPNSFAEADFKAYEGLNAGILNRTMDANPVKDWNFIYVPYCTGDAHIGNNPAGFVKTQGNQVFVGYANVTAYLNRIVPTFPNASQVLLTGMSAGGIGAAGNYVQTQKAFGSIPVSLIDDSGPPMSTDYLASCLQNELVTVWGLDKTILADCGPTCTPMDMFLPYTKAVAAAYPNRQLGLIETTQDMTMREFYGFGLSSSKTAPDTLDCTITGVPEMSASMFSAGLADARMELASATNFGSFVFNSTQHTSIQDDTAFYSESAGGMKLTDWVNAIITGTAPVVGPLGRGPAGLTESTESTESTDSNDAGWCESKERAAPLLVL